MLTLKCFNINRMLENIVQYREEINIVTSMVDDSTDK